MSGRRKETFMVWYWVIFCVVVLLYALPQLIVNQILRAIDQAKFVAGKKWYVVEKDVGDDVLILTVTPYDSRYRGRIRMRFHRKHPNFDEISHLNKMSVVKFSYTEVLTRILLETSATTYLELRKF